MDPATQDPDRATSIILMSRNRDNIYLSLCNVPKRGCYMQVLYGTETLLRALYGIPLKWEPHMSQVTWGESQIWSTENLVHLTRKGMAMVLETPKFATPNE